MNAPTPKPHRRWRCALLIVGAVLFFISLIAWFVVGRVIRSHLVSEARLRLGAELDLGFVLYVPPLGLWIHHARLGVPMPNGESVEVLGLSNLAVDLGALPHQGQPLEIKRIRADAPRFSLIRTPAGLMLRSPTAPQLPPVPVSETVRRTLDGLMHIRELRVTNGEFRYVDRRNSATEPLAVPNIRIALDFSGSGGPRAAYSLEAGTAGGIELRSKGATDLDKLTLDIQELSLSADAAAASELLLHGTRGQIGKATSIAGKVKVDGAGTMSLTQWDQSRLHGSLDVQDANATIPHCPIDRASTHVSLQMVPAGDTPMTQPAGGFALAGAFFTATLERLEATSGSARLRADGGTIAVNREGWKLAALLGTLDCRTGGPANSASFFDQYNLRGIARFTGTAGGPFHLPPGSHPIDAFTPRLVAYPRELAFQPPKFPIPFEHVNGGSIELNGGAISFKNLRGSYGADKLFLDSARLVLEDRERGRTLADLNQQVKFEDIVGIVVFDEPAPQYPLVLQKVLDQLHPTGAFSLGGWYAINLRDPQDSRKRKPDWFFRVSAENGAFAISDRRIPLEKVKGEAALSPLVVDIARVEANCLGGTATGAGTITPGTPLKYQANIFLSQVDVAQAKKVFALRDPKQGALGGRVSVRADIAGAGRQADRTVLQQLRAEGEFEVYGGDYWSLPVLGEVKNRAAPGGALTVGEAAGMFSIANSTVNFSDAAVSSPLLGLQGSGKIGFDKSLDLNLVIAPLGDWRDRMRQGNIPIVSDVAGEVLGAVQKLFNAAQSALVNVVHVTGTIDAPVIKDVPVPALTDGLKLLFGRMLEPPKGGQLIDAIRESGKRG